MIANNGTMPPQNNGLARGMFMNMLMSGSKTPDSSSPNTGGVSAPLYDGTEGVQLNPSIGQGLVAPNGLNQISGGYQNDSSGGFMGLPMNHPLNQALMGLMGQQIQ